jgi:hypothetical protein
VEGGLRRFRHGDDGFVHGEIKLVDDKYQPYKFELKMTDSTGKRVSPDVTECVTIWR